MQKIVDLGSGSDPLEPMRLLVASIRTADEIATLAAGGCNTFTIAPVGWGAGRGGVGSGGAGRGCGAGRQSCEPLCLCMQD